MEKIPGKLEVITRYFDEFSQQQLEQFALLEPLYTEWNAKINVISRKDIEALYEKHVLHSLSIAAVFNFEKGTTIIDIGTGGGFPGIPLAIFFPEVNFLLVDSIGKKIKVVDEVSQALGLKNVVTRHARAEDINNQKFDFVVSRAVAPLKDLWRWGKPLLKKGTKAEGFKNGLICLKGGLLEAEIKESTLRPRLWDIKQFFQEPFFEEKQLVYVPY